MTEHHPHHHHSAHEAPEKGASDTKENAGSSSSATSTNAPADQVGQQNAPVSGEQSAKGALSAAEPRDPPASQPVGDVKESSDGNGT